MTKQKFTVILQGSIEGADTKEEAERIIQTELLPKTHIIKWIGSYSIVVDSKEVSLSEES